MLNNEPLKAVAYSKNTAGNGKKRSCSRSLHNSTRNLKSVKA